MEEKKICYYCGNEIEEGEAYEVTLSSGEVVHACEDCMRENTYFCDCCENIFDNDFNNYLTRDGAIVCDNCYDSNYVTCECCGEVVHVEHSYYISSTCEHVCDSCYSDNYFTCDTCGEVYHVDVGHFEGYDAVCDECFSKYYKDDRILEYHEFDDWRFFKNDDEIDPVYFGFELEVEPKSGRCNESDALDILENNLHVTFAEDGSLNDNGFEIISHPHSFNYIMSHFENYKSAFNKLRELDYISHDSGRCGLHFHVTAPKENREEIINRLWIILETYQEQVKKLSRRDSYSYCHLLSENEHSSNVNKGVFYYVGKAKKDDSRYLALNVTKGATLELRIFRGTLKTDTFFAALEFTKNLFALAYDTTKSIFEITWSDLIKGDFIEMYCHTNGILTDKKIVNDSLKYIEFENKSVKKMMSLYRKFYKLASKELEIQFKKTYNKKCDFLDDLKNHFRFYRYQAEDLLLNIEALKENAQKNDFNRFAYFFDCYNLKMFRNSLDQKTQDEIIKAYKSIKKFIDKGVI